MAVVSDLRTGNPTSNDESSGGDAAAALIFGDDDDAPVLAHALGRAASTGEFLDRYRLPGEGSSRIWEERFGEQAYLALAEDAIERATKAADVGIEDVDKVVIAGLHARAVRGLSKIAGDKLVDDLTGNIGNPGAAQLPLLVASVLDQAAPEETILCVHLADGAYASVIRTTDAIATYTPFATVES